MQILQIIILAIVQGMAELLPVSSSAHVIVAEKLMGIDPSSPEMTFLLVMLHTGTMGAVLVYFWKRWRVLFNGENLKSIAQSLVLATAITGVIGLVLKHFIEKMISTPGESKAEIEQLFGNLTLVSISLFLVGILIILAGKKQETTREITQKHAAVIGAVQGLCLPFRGFSRSGATISTGLFFGIQRRLVEEFSFALAVILTPPVVARELMRLLNAHAFTDHPIGTLLAPGLLGMVFAFFAGLVALKWVSAWIDKGKWSWFGYYCLIASGVVFYLSHTL